MIILMSLGIGSKKGILKIYDEKCYFYIVTASVKHNNYNCWLFSYWWCWCQISLRCVTFAYIKYLVLIESLAWCISQYWKTFIKFNAIFTHCYITFSCSLLDFAQYHFLLWKSGGNPLRFTHFKKITVVFTLYMLLNKSCLFWP